MSCTATVGNLQVEICCSSITMLNFSGSTVLLERSEAMALPQTLWRCREISLIASARFKFRARAPLKGIGGDIRTSIAAVERDGDRCRLEKHGSTISYADQADAFLATVGLKGDKLFDGTWGYDSGFRYNRIQTNSPSSVATR